ncbi:MAG: alanine racemase [Candidatus Vogelbacteria bacterium]|nr:alanine racemase [Candidatus Vogelbacteria bacterium]
MIAREKLRGIRTWVEIDKTAIAHNYELFRRILAGKTKLMAVAKSNAYGHDMRKFVAIMARLGVDWIGVDSIMEANAIRTSGVLVPTLVLGHTRPERYADALRHNVSITVSSLHALKEAANFSNGNHPLAIHLKIDSGMHRQGIGVDELEEAITILAKEGRGILLEGVYTHFAGAKDATEREGTVRQIGVFNEACDSLHRAGFEFMRHAAATSGALQFPEAHFDMVRIGIGLYGLWPSASLRTTFENEMPLRPALSWKTIIGELKRVQKGEGIGYDHTEILTRDSVLAVCPIGYWHGYPRILSGKGEVVVRNKKARVIGRVSMDMISIDVTDIADVAEDDEVTLLGGAISADQIAHAAETINYEIVTRINPLIKRFY